ncbi:major facilitator superfamily domain-containing protein [Halteromyces radiatus]|uniref:major facilitator superfamily domain-containing protein n=1 Tax=Halteromyces radiatus TaxID=101107 RepID=UPI00221F2147|nr:major facilitator superfamily domain-containing protein [Halteromyces radiatus]KAI8096838.1 major facilitator superfamily domain-containing protein [Halteromyces radiatus]
MSTEIKEKIEVEHSECHDHFNDTIEDNSPKATVIKSDAEKIFVKKLNWTLLPFIWSIIFIQFADKSSLSLAAVLGMLQDTHTSQSQYSFLGSVFYIGYIVWQIPNNYFIQRLPIRRYLGVLLVLWGISVGCTALCQNFTQLVICRVLLGLFEAGTYPCLYIVLNSLYRRQEQSACFGFLWMSNGSGTIFAVLISYGIAHLDGAHGIAAWRWNYMIYGILTVVIGIATFFFMVDSPQSKYLRLTEAEKKIVEARTQDNAVVMDRAVKVSHYWEAVKEPRYYLVLLAAFCNNLSNSGLVVFSTPFVATLGFTSLNSILLQIPSAAISVLFVLLAVVINRKSKNMSLPTIVCGGIAMIGCILLACLPHTSIKLLGYYLAWGFNGSYVMLLTIVSNNVSGYSKKIWYNASVMVAYTVGAFVGPLVMLDYEFPVYRTGMIIFVIGNLLVVLSVCTMLYLMKRTNKKRAQNTHGEKTDAHLDLTDKQDKNFFYKL